MLPCRFSSAPIPAAREIVHSPYKDMLVVKQQSRSLLHLLLLLYIVISIIGRACSQ